jgi:hypothetical protein
VKLEFSGQSFEKYSNVKFHENLSSGSGVVACGKLDGQTAGTRTDITNLIAAFLNFANMPKVVVFSHA